MKKIVSVLLCIMIAAMLPVGISAETTVGTASASTTGMIDGSTTEGNSIDLNAAFGATTLDLLITERISVSNSNSEDPTALVYTPLKIENKMGTGKLVVEKLELNLLEAAGYTLSDDTNTSWETLSINDKKLSMLVSCGGEVSSHDMTSPLTQKLELANGGSITYTFSGHTGISAGYNDDIATLVVTLSLKEFEPTALKISGTGVTFKIANTNYSGTLQTSTDGRNWTNYTEGTTVNGGSENTIYVRGKNNTIITGSGRDAVGAKFVIGGTNVSVSGDLDTLLDYKAVGMGKEVTSGQGAFFSLFKECSSITDASGLIVSGDNMKQKDYAELFSGCVNLENAPALPATTLAASCYTSMFEGCTSLKNAPALPATTLTDNCYTSMFEGCTSLKNGPALPAVTLKKMCYYRMFYGCTKLESAPELPATTLAASCYEGMFINCTSLESAPALPATTLASACYKQMFMNSGIKVATALPATTLSGECYSGMFDSCTMLNTIPKLPATKLAEQCYYKMFRGCSSLYFSRGSTSLCNKEVLNLTASKLETKGLPTNAVKGMFEGTSKDTADPEYKSTYYTSNAILG